MLLFAAENTNYTLTVSENCHEFLMSSLAIIKVGITHLC